MIDIPPLSLYVHLPWCVRKCPYCDFNSYTLKGALPEADYIEALVSDLRAQVDGLAGPRPIVSIFFGGGTPSLFSPAGLSRFLDSTHRMLPFRSDIEITLEANPGTIERGRFAEYRAAGVNRVSLGAQSFDARQLSRLGRIHSAEETHRAVEELHSADLGNFNLDLMYGLPEQTLADAVADVEIALSLSPAHLSHYQLAIEPGTVFAARPPSLPEDDAIDAMFAGCQTPLEAAGFVRYEVSAYSRAGRHCRHNLNYWAFGDYLGVGAGAHGKLTDAASGDIVRTWQVRDPRRYMRAAPQALSRRPIPTSDLPFEFMMNTLRLVEGFESAEFASRTGVEWQLIEPSLERLRERDLVERVGSRWRPSPLGLRFLNDVVAVFLPERASRHVVEGGVNRPSPLYTASFGHPANERIT
jgi:putative oxygen-independent coproporphyrinogen III oxidase